MVEIEVAAIYDPMYFLSVYTSYGKAGFCWEELILSNPHHHLYHQRYAEVSYTEGSTEGLELARKHFAAALKLNQDNVRALYGLCWVGHMITNT